MSEETQFKPGQSGNPGGRPKLTSEFRELCRANTPEYIAELERLALKGKREATRTRALNLLLAYGWGRPTVSVAPVERDEFGNEKPVPSLNFHQAALRLLYVLEAGAQANG